MACASLNSSLKHRQGPCQATGNAKNTTLLQKNKHCPPPLVPQSVAKARNRRPKVLKRGAIYNQRLHPTRIETPRVLPSGTFALPTEPTTIPPSHRFSRNRETHGRGGITLAALTQKAVAHTAPRVLEASNYSTKIFGGALVFLWDQGGKRQREREQDRGLSFLLTPTTPPCFPPCSIPLPCNSSDYSCNGTGTLSIWLVKPFWEKSSE